MEVKEKPTTLSINHQLSENGKRSSLWATYLAVFSADLYVFTVGMVEAYSAPATVDITKKGSRFMHITEDQITWIASLPVLVCGIGCFASGYATQRLGRRATLVLISLPYVMSWLMVAYAPSITWIYIGRLLSGFCFGVSCVAAPAYVTEISPVKIRGFLGSLNHLSFTVGCFVMITLGYALRWSWLAVSGAIVPTLAICLMCLMPESPEWLLRNSRRSEAAESLRFFHGRHLDTEKELEYIAANLGPKFKTSWRQFLDPTLYKPTIISLSLVFFSKCAGINVITSYTVQIFQKTGSALDAQSSAVLFAAVNIMATLGTNMLIDRVGRRILFILSGTFLTFSLSILGLYELLQEKEYDLSNWHWIPLVCFFIYISFHSLGLGPMPMVMTPELVPISSRSTVLAMTITFSSLLAFLLTKLFAIMVHHLRYYGLFWTFGVFTFLGTLFGVFCLPETKGRTINEINNSFRSSTIKANRIH